MKDRIKTHLLGKLRIYVKTGEKIKSKALRSKLFPTSVHKGIIDMAKEDGLMNASVYTTQMGFSNYERVSQFAMESDNLGLTVCIELIDKKENLQTFFLKHKSLFKDKVVVYKEVEYWDAD
ncbi:MAG: DUF190 domain-containing protein [Mangrovibacterium sp.]